MKSAPTDDAGDASPALYRTLFDHAPVGILYADATSRYIDANRRVCEMLGYAREELIGLHAADIVAPAEVGQVDQALEDIRSRAEHRREWRFRRKDGTTFDAEVIATKFADGTLLGMIRDITVERERERAVALVRNEKQFSDTMIESMPGIVYFYDLSGRFLRWNRNFEVVSGCTGDEIAGMHPLQFFTGDDRRRVEERIAEVFEKGESTVEADFVARDGMATPYFFTGRRVIYDGQPCLVGVGIDVSDRRRFERRLAESERKYRELVEHANSIILHWDVDGRIKFLNEYGLRFFGYAAEEIVGRHVTGTIVPASETSGRDLATLMEQICAMPDAFEQNVNENMRRDGERVWISWTNRVERDASGNIVGILSVGTDITERRHAEERLRVSEAHLVEAQRIAKMGSWELDIRNDRITWSEQIHDIFGLPPSTVTSKVAAFLEFVHPDDRDRVQAAYQAALIGHSRLDIEHRVVIPDGTEKVVHALADLKKDADGRPAFLSGTVHDITDRVRVREEQEKRHRAEAADRIKSAFLATMSHELRTPLNSIIGFTGILAQGLAGPLNEEQGKQLEMVRNSARHLLALVNDVLDISKIEAGQLDVARDPFDLTRSLRKVLKLVAPQAEGKGLQLTAQIEPLPATLIGDERRLEQILLNLLSNAIKFTDQGEVRLTAMVESASLADPEHDGGDWLRITVQDTGIGIRPEDLATLFQPFRQLDSGLARRHEGTGLGLAICRRLAALMGGEILAESEFGKGSIFTVRLPVNPPVKA